MLSQIKIGSSATKAFIENLHADEECITSLKSDERLDKVELRIAGDGGKGWHERSSTEGNTADREPGAAGLSGA
jgi:hypothetical protein